MTPRRAKTSESLYKSTSTNLQARDMGSLAVLFWRSSSNIRHSVLVLYHVFSPVPKEHANNLVILCVDPLPVLHYISELSPCEDVPSEVECQRTTVDSSENSLYSKFYKLSFHRRSHGSFIPFRPVSDRGLCNLEG